MKAILPHARACLALTGALLACLPAGAAVRFVALGDAGEGNAAQYDNAKAIAQVCSARGCDFAIYLGDNFYGTGISRSDDPQFQTKFELPYADLSLPFYALLGNHDYGNPPKDLWKPDFQIAYTERSAKWRMPHYFYKFSKENVDFFALDTQGFVAGLNDGEQREWLTEGLAASAAQWKIVMGHHPYISNGQHGNAGAYDGCGKFCPDEISGANLKHLMENAVCSSAQVYFSGHDHNLQWLEARCGTEFIVSGAGAKYSALRHRQNNPVHFESDAGAGFMWVEIDGDQFTGAFYDKDGQLLYTRSFASPAARPLRPSAVPVSGPVSRRSPRSAR